MNRKICQNEFNDLENLSCWGWGFEGDVSDINPFLISDNEWQELRGKKWSLFIETILSWPVISCLFYLPAGRVERD